MGTLGEIQILLHKRVEPGESRRAGAGRPGGRTQVRPGLGRAKSHTQRGLGYADAGTISLALYARVVAKVIKG